MPAPARQWTAAEDALLGTMPDAALAKRLKIARKTVVERRGALMIGSHRNAPQSRSERTRTALRELLAAIEAARVPKSVRIAADAARAAIGSK